MTESALKVEVSQSGPCERKINVTVLPEAVKSERAKVLNDIRKSARIKGFRPGKAPRNLVEKTYGDTIREELMQKVVSENFHRALDQEKIEPVNQPLVESIDLDDDDKLVFEARFEVSPEIDLKTYTGFKIEKKNEKVTEEQIDNAIDSIRQQQASFMPKEGAAEKGDYLLLDFKVLDEDGQSSPEAERTNQLVLAGHEDDQALFSHSLVGLGEGEGQKIEIDFPEDYADESLKGRKVEYLVDVKGIRKKTLPEIDDDFAKQVSPAENIAGLKDLIRENLEREILQRNEHQVEEDLFKKILEENPFEVPPSLVTEAIKRQIENIKREGRPVEDEQRVGELIRPSAEFAVKRDFLIGKILKAEDISVSEEDIEAKIVEFAGQLGKGPEEVKKDFRSREALAQLQSLISVDKVVKFLLENNDIIQADS